jgi:hypothetical protein
MGLSPRRFWRTDLKQKENSPATSGYSAIDDADIFKDGIEYDIQRRRI